MTALLTALSLIMGVNTSSLQPATRAALGRARYALASRGVAYQLTSAWRSRSEQARLFHRRGRRYPAARPGGSEHERGTAVDLVFTGRSALGAQIMRQHGFVQNVPRDRPHWAYRGVKE